MCSAEQPKEQLQTGDRGSNPVTVNQSFFSFESTCSRCFVSFVNVHYFTWLICLCSTIFTENEAEII